MSWVVLLAAPQAGPPPAESVSFGPESGARDFYRDLAERYAPLVAQETGTDPRADYLVRFDYDGDWRGDNNWDNLAQGSSQAYVYYAAMETATHHFLIYSFFHARRYAERCPAQTCHENDNGGLLLVVQKDGSRYGRIQAMETLARNSISAYTADPRIREGAHRISGEVKVWRESRAVVFIEAGSHGVYSAGDRDKSRFSAERLEFDRGTTGITYRYGGSPARPTGPGDREVSYELLPMLEHWWTRATARAGLEERSFDEYFRYAPFGSRPRASAEEIAGAFFGRKHAPNKAQPFWAWYDTLALTRKVLALGQWGLDPAYAVSVTLRLPAGTPFSLDYMYNPYLEGAGSREAVTITSGAPAGGSQRQLLSPPAEKPKLNPKSRQGELEFRGRVDGALYLHIRGEQIEVEYLSGRPMDEIRYRFSQPLPVQELEEVKLEGIDGRGAVRLIEWPNAGNRYTAKVRIQDEKSGAAMYRFKLVWRR